MQTLSELVAAAQKAGTTYRALAARARDPESDYQVPLASVHKLAHGEDVMISPRFVRAIAAALNISAREAAQAAAFQFTGFTVEDPIGGHADEDEVIRVARRPGSTPASTAEVESFVDESRRRDRKA